MVENICSKCGADVEYTIDMYTNKTLRDCGEKYWQNNYDTVHTIHPDYRIVEHWCLRCLFLKQPPMGNREPRALTTEELEEYDKLLENMINRFGLGTLRNETKRTRTNNK